MRPATLVRICDECNYGTQCGRCLVCGGTGVADAYYCQECTQLEKDVSFFSFFAFRASFFFSISFFAHQKNFLLNKTKKQRDGCPKVINVGVAKTDAYFERKQRRGGGGG